MVFVIYLLYTLPERTPSSIFSFIFGLVEHPVSKLNGENCAFFGRKYDSVELNLCFYYA